MRGNVGGARVLLLAALLLASPGDGEGLKPLMAGSLTWKVNDRFMAGGDANRRVTLELKSVFEMVSGCTTDINSPVSCNGQTIAACTQIQTETQTKCTAQGWGDAAFCQLQGEAALSNCKIAENFGVLCVKQLVPSTNGDLQTMFWSDNSQCTHNVNMHGSKVFSLAGTVSRTDVNKIGKANAFTVQSVRDQVVDSTSATQVKWERQVSKTSVVIGTMTHTVTLVDRAVGLVAFWAPRTGFDNFITERGLLLPECTVFSQNNPTACAVNVAARKRAVQSFSVWPDWTVQGTAATPDVGMIYESSSGIGDFWENFLLRQGAAGEKQACNNDAGCIRPASPSLETYVPLCWDHITSPGLPFDAYSCLRKPVNNYYSPVASAPLLVEVAVTATAASNTGAASDRFSVGGSSFVAPHAGVMVHTSDYDGQKMTVYPLPDDGAVIGDEPVGASSLDKFRAVCFLGDRRGAFSSQLWPTKRCTSGSRLGEPCVQNSDCSCTSCCLRPILGCRDTFDFDRAPANAAGTVLKLNYQWLRTSGQLFGTNFASTEASVPRKAFMQHVFNTVDHPFIKVDNPTATDPHLIDRPKWSLPEGPTSVQTVFATFPCFAGTNNTPPVFVTGTGSTSQDVQTAVSCDYRGPCSATIYARDFAPGTTSQTSQKVGIEAAIGFPKFTTNTLSRPDGSTCEDKVGLGQVTCVLRLEDDDFDGEKWAVTAIGKIIVRCVVAYDRFDAVSNTQRTCRSAPLCIKFKIEGTRPRFVEPTPLEANSFDDNGVLVPGRTDVPACEGFPMQLTAVAEDDNPAEDVRIFIGDPFVDPDLYPDAPQLLYLKGSGGQYNGDFFYPLLSNPPSIFNSNTALIDTCGTFTGYGATRVGDNAYQTSIDAVAVDSDQSGVRSVMADYYPNITGVRNPSQRIVFNVDVTVKNGLTSRSIDQCDPNPEPGKANCREKLVNMDQVICGAAYDNARKLTKRWAGARDPNGDDINVWRRDHSNGDYASDLHCWRIRIAAPPIFVTDLNGTSSPFSPLWPGVVDSSGDDSAYKHVQIFVGEERSFTFIAQDPNPDDSVRILLLEEPGMPDGMKVSRSSCIPRGQEQKMCGARDIISLSYPNEEWSATQVIGKQSECSRAQITIKWAPPEKAAGTSFKVCLAARDNNRICYGRGPTKATPEGWFGETLCIVFEVQGPVSTWVNTSFATPVKSYIGCANEFPLHLMSRPYDGIIVTNGEWPVEATLGPMTAGGDVGGVIEFRPKRGSEGSSTTVCVAASDVFRNGGGTSRGKYCEGGPLRGRSCLDSSDCGGSGICTDACVTFVVQRCLYCVQDTDTLMYLARDYSLYVNWMRLWVLNSNQDMQEDNAAERRYSLITSPDLLLGMPGEHKVFVGTVYELGEAESLPSLAKRFRTTVKSILALNPDVGDPESVAVGRELCMAPCSAETVDHMLPEATMRA